jgi:hypothetical protein
LACAEKALVMIVFCLRICYNGFVNQQPGMREGRAI